MTEDSDTAISTHSPALSEESPTPGRVPPAASVSFADQQPQHARNPQQHHEQQYQQQARGRQQPQSQQQQEQQRVQHPFHALSEAAQHPLAANDFVPYDEDKPAAAVAAQVAALGCIEEHKTTSAGTPGQVTRLVGSSGSGGGGSGAFGSQASIPDLAGRLGSGGGSGSSTASGQGFRHPILRRISDEVRSLVILSTNCLVVLLTTPVTTQPNPDKRYSLGRRKNRTGYRDVPAIEGFLDG